MDAYDVQLQPSRGFGWATLELAIASGICRASLQDHTLISDLEFASA